MANVFLSEFIAEDMAEDLKKERTLRDWITYASASGWKIHFEGFSFGIGITVSTGPKHNYLTHSRVVSWDEAVLGKRELIGYSLGLQIRSLESHIAGLTQGEGI